MKFITSIILASVLLVISSCKKEEGPAPTNQTSTPVKETLVLVKKFFDALSNSWSGELIYKGNKLDTIKFGVYYTVFTYEDDLITKSVASSSIQPATQTTEYTYQNNKLVKSYLKGRTFGSPTDFTEEKLYTHNSDGSIDFVHTTTYSSDVGTQKETGKLYFTDGNLTKRESSISNTSFVITTVVENTFDSNKNAYYNILGYKNLLEPVENVSINNVLSSKSTSTTVVEGVPTVGGNFLKYTYKYDVKGYPIEQKSAFNGIINSNITYIY
jgi:hypothetical protein